MGSRVPRLRLRPGTSETRAGGIHGFNNLTDGDLTSESVKATAFAEDPAYALLAQARRAGTVSRFHLIDDTDVAGTIPHLRKG